MPKYNELDFNFSTSNINKLVSNITSGLIKSNAVVNNLDGSMLKMTFIGLGQAGGRIVAPAHSIGFPTFVINSSKDDFKELDKYAIPKDNRVFTGVYDNDGNVIDSMQGTAKDRERGLEIAKLNARTYRQLATSPEVLGADFVWVATSLSGGTGSGAFRAVVLEIIKQRMNYNQATKSHTPSHENSVGLIVSIPSASEAGIAYRRNALQALEELKEMVRSSEKRQENGIDWLGCIYVIDNEHFSNSNFVRDYKENVTEGYKVSDLELSNAYMISSIFEFLTFLCLNSTITIDRRELANMLGTTGFLNIKRDISNDSLTQQLAKFKGNTTIEAEEEIKNIIQGYAKQFCQTQDVAMDMSTMKQKPIGACFSIINTEEVSETTAQNIVSAILNQEGITNAHPGVYPMNSQKGVSTFLAYVSESFPSHVAKRLREELDTMVKLEEDAELQRKKELEELDNEVFGNLNLGKKRKKSNVNVNFDDFDDFGFGDNDANNAFGFGNDDSGFGEDPFSEKEVSNSGPVGNRFGPRR